VSADGTITAIRGASAGQPAQLYRGTASLSHASGLPLGVNVNVNVDGLTISGNGNIAVAAASANAIMVAYAESALGPWADITGSLPITAGVPSLVYL